MRNNGASIRVSLRIVGIVLIVAMLGSCYSDSGVGKSPEISSEQALALAKDSYGGILPVQLVQDDIGSGPAVQPDRMVTAELSFSDAANSPVGSGRVRFLFSGAGNSLIGSPYQFGYVSPTLEAAMAGMRQGGRRRVRLVDSTCEDTSTSHNALGNNCEALGNQFEARTSGHALYPRRTELVLNVLIVRVCRPLIVQQKLPDLLGGGPGRKVSEIYCR